jgi:hypothetical protein
VGKFEDADKAMATDKPELLGTFQKIFDEIWQELNPSLSPEAEDERRSELARRIILAHRRGLKPRLIKAEVRREMNANS